MRKVSLVLLGIAGVLVLMTGNLIFSVNASKPTAGLGRQVKIAGDLWQAVDEKSIANGLERPIIPNAYLTVRLDKNSLGQFLSKVPLEYTKAAQGTEAVLHLPMPDGTVAKFSVVESPIMEPKLAAQYPNIKTYRGQGIDDPTATVRFDWTPAGFHAFVLSAQGTIVIDPYAKGDTDNYISYYERDLQIQSNLPQCLTTETGIDPKETRSIALPANVTNGTGLRIYRLAVAATGEFTQANGTTVNTALMAITTTINRVILIYERDLAVRFVLVNNETSIIYTNPASDPYTNDDADGLANQSNLDAVIGVNNYDIGHVFDTGGVSGGNAQIGSVCVAGLKANARSVLLPNLNTFAIHTVAHEFGHQFGALHSFNAGGSSSGPCNSQRTPSAAFEPGAGSTIMSYAGACSAENLQLNPIFTYDDYFHVDSLERMVNHITGLGNCVTPITTGNNPPGVNAGADYTIPKGTPFTLTATGSDTNGDALTYDWEEYDLGPVSPPDTDADGQARPIFRSYLPTSNPARTFPALAYILNNGNVPPRFLFDTLFSQFFMVGETLPVISRTMNFQVTARDNHSGGGGISSDTVQVTVDGTSGPFYIVQPSVAATWPANSQQTIVWNVGNTASPPINCANVKISLSTDGGNTFTTVLAPSTPNDGSETIIVPSIVATAARVKVEAIGNIFFDISDTNVIIPNAGCSYSISPASRSLGASSTTKTVSVTASGGCGWTAKSNADWITINSGSTGTGNGTVTYTISANTAAARTGTISVAGQTHTISQNAGGTCSVGLSPASGSFSSDGGALAVTVSPGACDWLAVSNTSWIKIISGSGGTGSGTVLFAVAANPSSTARNGSLTIAGQTFTVTQAGTVASQPKITAASATASATDAGFTPAAVIDGNLGTLWSAGNYPPQWIEINLGASYSISKIKLRTSQSPAGNTVHQIYMGSQPNPPTLVTTLNEFTQQQQWISRDFATAVTSVQYVRVLTTSSPSWVGWFEIELYGTPTSGGGGPDPKITAVSATASQTTPGFTTFAAIDGSLGTNWSAGDFAPQWIEINLGATYSISKIKLNPSQSPNGVTTHEIYMGTSPNPTTLVATITQFTQNQVWFEQTFTPKTASVQYVRVRTTSSPSWISWYEIELYGTPASPPPPPPGDVKITAVSATASQTTPGFTTFAAIDGSLGTNWAAGDYPTQWIEIDLGATYSISKIKLDPSQSPNGTTTHEIYMSPSPMQAFPPPGSLVTTITQFTQNQVWFEKPFSPVISNVRYVQVRTTANPSWVSWYEIELYRPQ